MSEVTLESCLDILDKYVDKSMRVEKEMGLMSEVTLGVFPREWFEEIKKMNWDVAQFKEMILKEIENDKGNESVSRGSGDEEHSRSDTSDEECGRGHMVDSCPEGCGEGECEHPRTD